MDCWLDCWLWFDKPRDNEPMAAACNVVERVQCHGVHDHDVDTAVFVRLLKGALEVRMPLVE